MQECNKKKEEIINTLYLKRNDEIYDEDYNNEYQIMERDKNRLGECLINFLKETMSFDKFQIAKDYIEALDEKSIAIKTIMNKRFYGAGFCDGIKMI